MKLNSFLTGLRYRNLKRLISVTVLLAGLPSVGHAVLNWSSFGDVPTASVTFASNPAAVSWGAGRFDVFGRGADNTLYHNYYDSGIWHSWAQMSGVFYGNPAVSSWASNRLHIAVRGGSNHCYLNYYDGTGWQGWQDLGGSLASDPVMVSSAVGRLDIFARDTNNVLVHKWYDGSWHDWVNDTSSGAFNGTPAVISWAPNQLHVVVRGGSNYCYLNYFDGSSWHGWEYHGGSLASDPVLASWAEGRLDIFARDTSDCLTHSYYDGSWSGWETLSTAFSGTPAVACREQYLLDVVVRGSSGDCRQRKFNGTAWGSWNSLGGNFVSDPVIAPVGGGRQYSGGRQDVFCVNNSSVMQTCTWQGGPIGFYKQAGEYYKDFHLIKSGSDYHLFSNVGVADGTQSWTQSGNEKEFVHATTTDFNTWSVKSRVIPVRSGLWDESVVSAPSIQLLSGTYYMMYTGFGPASNYLQRVGYATSTDLYSWSRISNPTYAPPSWAQSNTDCRDSHLIRDGSQWVMYTCVQHNDGSGAVSIDTSSDLNSWTNQGWAAKKPGPNMALESPFVFKNGSKWFLFTSSSGVGAYSSTSSTATNWAPLSSFSFLPNCYAYEFVNTGSGWVAGAFFWKLNGNYLKFWKVEFDANGDPFIDF